MLPCAPRELSKTELSKQVPHGDLDTAGLEAGSSGEAMFFLQGAAAFLDQAPLGNSRDLRDKSWQAACHTEVPAPSLSNLNLPTWARSPSSENALGQRRKESPYQGKVISDSPVASWTYLGILG